MQKIILLVDPRGIDKALLDFGSSLAASGNISLYGLFLHPDNPVLVQEDGYEEEKLFTGKRKPARSIKHGVTPVEDSKKQFLAYFKNHAPRLIPDTGDAFTDYQIIEETRFADGIIISADSNFSGASKSVPTRLTEYILKKSECPVIVAPISSNPIDEVVFAYDGSASSVFAAKEFTRVFPQFEDKRVTFLEVKVDDSSAIANQQKITDYLKMHYSSIGYRVLHGNPGDELFSYFLEKKNTFLVLGAFGRSPISSLVHRSSASLLLKTTTLPLFIAHR